MKVGAVVAVLAVAVACFSSAVAHGGRAAPPPPPFADSRPRWSSDNAAIAFVRAGVVHVVPAAGGALEPAGRRPLTSDDFDRWVQWFDWSPTSNVIGILSQHRFMEGHLYTTDGRISQTFVPSFCSRASWSGDGLLLAYSSSPSDSCGRSRFTVVDRDGKVVIEGDGTNPVVSPDGRQIAFHRYGSPPPGSPFLRHSTWVLDIRTGAVRQLLSVGEQAFWSPDGTHLAVLDDGPSTVPEVASEVGVYVVDVDGRNPRKVGVVNQRLYQVAPKPSWSPDGRRLAYNARNSIHVVDVDGPGVTNVGNGILQGWSPRKAELLVIQRGRAEVVGLNRKRRFIGRGVSASWSQDGERVAFVGSWRCGPRQGIWTATRTGTRRTRLTNACPIVGSARNEVLFGTRWRDTVYAYGGDDTVRVRGGGRDRVFCGEGRDVVIADRLDHVVDCERVDRR